MSSGDQMNIYLSAYRACATNCSVIGSCSGMFRRFSGRMKFGCLHNVRLGSSGGTLNARISHRSDVNRKLVKGTFFRELVRSSEFSGVPLMLRAPSRDG